MHIKTIDYPSVPYGMSRVSWGAIMAGAVVCLAAIASFGTLGAGIGLLSAPGAGTGDASLLGAGIAGAAYLLLAGVASFYAGGWVSGRLNGIARVSQSVVHGAVCWGLCVLAIGAGMAALTALAAMGLAGAADAAGAAGAPPIGGPPAESAARFAGFAGIAGFVTMLCELGACCLGARNGTRVMRPVGSSESAPSAREHIESL